LPHGYDRIPQARLYELAKAVRELEGPIYIHCHHGKHRSPAAACVVAGLIPVANALPVLEIAGTSPHYKGLFESVGSAKPRSTAELDAVKVEFRESVDVAPMAEAMVALEHTHDHIKEYVANGFKLLVKHPDLDPVHEGLLLREHFTELLRLEEVNGQTAEFQALIRDAESAAIELERTLRESGGSPNAEMVESLKKQADKIASNCKTCHEKFRDQPLTQN
jgi:hypothetical protein